MDIGKSVKMSLRGPVWYYMSTPLMMLITTSEYSLLYNLVMFSVISSEFNSLRVSIENQSLWK
jgi:hypothetical protein